MKLRHGILLWIGLSLAGCSAFDDGAAEGRRGMEHYEADEFDEAASAFQEGLERTENRVGRTRRALLTDLGLSHFQEANFTDASEAFSQSLSISESPASRAMASFNAGTALAHSEEYQQALSYFRRALVLRADFPEARFNYEWVKRQLDGSQAPSGTPPEPSAFAQQLKARADSLITARQYNAAANAMNEGLLQDSTVAAYADFMQRLGEVVDIEEMDAPARSDSIQLP